MQLAVSSRAWRFIALATVVANVAFNYLSMSVLAFGSDQREITERFDPLFQPATYAFSIWSVIYAGFLAYGVYALLPSQRDVPIHDRLSKPLVAANVLASLWIIAFRLYHIGTSVVLILASVGTAIALYRRSHPTYLLTSRERRVSRFVGVPFSLFLGWLSVAVIANLAIYSKYIALDAALPGEITWAVVLMLVACAIGIAVAVRYRDGFVPAVVSWASFAIWVEARGESAIAGGFALGVGIASALVALYFFATTALDVHHQSSSLRDRKPQV